MVAWLPVVDAVELLVAVATGSDASRAYEPHIDVDCAKLARQVRHGGRRTIGLLPAGASIGDPADGSLYAFACELAFAIGVLTHTLTVVLDPEQASGTPPADAAATFHAHVPAPNVAVLVPSARAPVGAKFEMVRLLAQSIAPLRAPTSAGSALGHVLVDLRGCRLPGELLGATHLLDGIMVVAKSGRVDERDLDRAMRMIPPHLRLGVVVTRDGSTRR